MSAGLRVGDEIAVSSSGHSAGSHNANGRILEVIAEAGTKRSCYRVKWCSGNDTFFRPDRDVRVLHRSADTNFPH